MFRRRGHEFKREKGGRIKELGERKQGKKT